MTVSVLSLAGPGRRTGRGSGVSPDQWAAAIGDVFPLPAPRTDGRIPARIRAARVDDVAIADLSDTTASWAPTAIEGIEDQVWLYVVERGSWTMDGAQVLRPGGFLLKRGRLARCATAPGTTARIVVLPAAGFGPLTPDRSITGPTDSPEARLLMAHAGMLHSTAAGLGAAGLHAARAALIELVRAVARGSVDDTEPYLAPALAQAARDRADRMLTEPELSPGMLARDLGVSLRTLQRAFTADGESATAYIRRRRLEEARLALATRPDLSITEIAAHWQFADASHLGRVFKGAYGCTPGDWAARAGRRFR